MLELRSNELVRGLEKVSGLKDLWKRVSDNFRPLDKSQKNEAKRFVASEDRDKWSKFYDLIKNPEFVKQLGRAGGDEKLVQHAKAMHSLQGAKVVANIEGSSGKSYDVKKLPNGKFGCTCRDWQFRGSTNPGYECKHIQAHKAGMTKVAMSFGDLTASFFDELAKIEQAQRDKANEAWSHLGEEGTSERPYSSMLTQDEEPNVFNTTRPAQAIEEPELILGSSG